MPWEGSVVADAMVVYLTGLEADADSGAVALAPRLPNQWPTMTWRDLRVGSMRFDLPLSALSQAAAPARTGPAPCRAG